MHYQAVANRCAVHFPSLNLKITEQDVIACLKGLGFSIIHIDVILLARNCIEMSKYQRSARIEEAPGLVNCSSLTKWLYAQKGIWLPRLAIQQRQIGVEVTKAQKGDLIFTTGSHNFYESDPSDGVGHVGIVTGKGTLIHAVSRKSGMVEISLKNISPRKFRGIRRICESNVVTLSTPPSHQIETSDDLKWLILKNL